MELKFLGRGSAFNPGEGSTSAFFTDNNELFVIDAGESVFSAMMARRLFDSVSKINLLITHTHSDHIGSLGSIILYASGVKNIKINIISNKKMAYYNSIRELMGVFGLPEAMYRIVSPSAFDNKYSNFNKVRYVKTIHCKDLEAYGIMSFNS
jgi:ribonuclease BN (tRNA processing enzyme)